MKDIYKAMELQRNGHYGRAAAIFQKEANKERPIKEKEELWKQAERCRDISRRD